ncbi:MAG TPA: ABC transporter substrate-binding protein [Acidimicrobiales bacterium]|nr:ABC transporter substrate-binding protein [Acidimicrobiales bacterium]
MRHTWVRVVAAAAAATIIASACSSDRDDDPTATGDPEEAGTDTTAAPDSDGDAVMFGDLASPCGEGEDDAGGDAGAGGQGEQGVTDSQVVIGYGDDAGTDISPGLSHEASDAIEAMIAWCNEQGGINGREIVGNYYDAALFEVPNAITQACAEVFMLVGEGWAFDSDQEQIRLECGVPAVPTYSVSPAFANGPLAYQPVPNPADIYPAGWAGQVAELFPEEVTQATVMFANIPATIDTKDKVLQTFDDFGFEFLDCPVEYNAAGEPDWRPFAQRLRDCGAEVVYYSGQAFPHMQNLLDDAAQIGYEPIWLTESNNYLQSFAEWNSTGNGDRVYVRTAFTPFEQADLNPAIQQYVDVVTEHGGDISQLGAQATSSFLLWATAANECGADLTRQCVLDELSQITSWTGGGMHAEANPGENLPPECAMTLKLDGTSWVQAFPEEEGEFACDPDSPVELTGRVVDQAELNEDRVSTAFQPE